MLHLHPLDLLRGHQYSNTGSSYSGQPSSKGTISGSVVQFGRWWCTLVFSLIIQVKVSQYLSYDIPFVDKADNLHLTSAVRASQGVNLPDKRRLRTFLMHSRYISCGIRLGLYPLKSITLRSSATTFSPSLFTLSSCFFLSPRIRLLYQP